MWKNKKDFLTQLLIFILLITFISLLIFGQPKATQKNSIPEESAKTFENPVRPKENDLKQEPYVYEETILTLRGTLEKITRPESYIAYDYVLNLEEPLHGWDATGTRNGITSVYIFSEVTADGRVTQEVIDKLKEYENSPVEIIAVIEWGYAENSYLLIKEIKKL